jgi:hypothetical protein
MTSRAVAGLLVLAIASCSDSADSTSSGPLADLFDGVGAITCLPRRPGQAATFADVYVRNVTDDELTLTGLSFAETDGVTLLGAVIAPEALPVVAAGRGWPPQSVPDEVWAQTRPLEGAQVGDGTEVISIGLRLDEARGEANEALLDYEIDGKRYQVETGFSYFMEQPCTEPEADD